MKKLSVKYFTLLILALAFAAPGIMAYLFYKHPLWLGATKTNKGRLLSAPIHLALFDGKSRWRLVYWKPNGCDKACLNQLNTLGRVRLALGRKLYQVDELLILDGKSKMEADELRPILKEQDIHVSTLEDAEAVKLIQLPPEERIFIVNPDNYIVLSYKAGGNPDDIYKDLKLLLSTTEMKSG